MSELIQEEFLSLSRKRAVAVIILLGFCASVMMYQIIAQGIGVSPDSTVYIEVARNLLTGKGFLVYGQPMTHFPPVYPILLAAIGLFTGDDLLLAARLLSALLFGANLVLVALAVYICTRYDVLATGCVILIFLFSTPTISIHSMAWSEAPFIAFSMAGFILLSHHVVRPNLSYLLLASLMFGLAAATRYIGISIFPTVVLALLVLSNKSLRTKIRDVIFFSGIACLPLVSWLIHNMLVAHSMTSREFDFHPVSVIHVKELIVQMYDFVLPISISAWTKALHVVVTAVLFALAMRFLFRKIGIQQSMSSIGIVLPLILVMYSMLYVIFLFFSISFFDAHTPVNDRLLLPVFLALIIACTSVAKVLSDVWPQKGVWYGFVFIVLFSLSINAVPTISRAVNIHHEGSGYNARYWMRSATLDFVARVPETMRIYSNGPDVIRFHTQKKATMIPSKVISSTRRENEYYQRHMSEMIRECEEGNAVVVHFDRITTRWYLPSKKEIESHFKIPLARKLEDGLIYGLSVAQNRAE